jgi:outer membrane lipoprotein-sorting protein
MSLLPKSGKAGRYLKQIDVDIDTANWLPWQVVIFEVSGDQTTIRLSDLHENTPLPEALFSVDHPPGVQLLPMGGERPQ